MSEEHFWKIFPAEFPEYLLRKNICFLISGHEWGAFLENFSSFISWVPSQEKSLFSLFGYDSKGGHFSRTFQDSISRPLSAKLYNDNMGSVDTFDSYLHTYTLRYIPLKNNLSWVCKPVLSIIDYQILNCFLLHREMHENPTCYRKYLLRLAQGFCTQSMKRPSAPVRVGNRTISRSRLGWFTAYLANVFLTKLQDPILPGRPRDHINPKHASYS